MSIVTLWLPVYGIEGVIKAVTAAASLAAAIILWKLIPEIIALPSPAQLERVNQDLKANIAEKERAYALLEDSEARIRAINLDLEKRVTEKTAELTASNRQLATSLEHRDTLIREVYHRVKNNLQTIDALIAVQSRRLTDDTARKALHDLRQRVYALGLVHQQLMNSNDLKTFDIAPFLEDLTHNLVEAGFQQGVKMTVRSIPLAVGFDFAIPLGLLVTELVTNSLKHAFPDGVGKIMVVLERNDDQKLTLIVSDNGKGQTSADSFPYGTTPGRGINIITGLVNQLKGSLVDERRKRDAHRDLPFCAGDGLSEMEKLQDHVLIVEDEFLIVMGLQDQIEEMGWQVCATVATADAAIAAARKHRPSIVLMDVRLQGDKDGVDAAQAIQESVGSKVIFITGSREPATIARIEQGHPLAVSVQAHFGPATPGSCRKRRTALRA